MARLAWISLGGAAGTAARYVLSSWLLRVLGPAFPYGTLAVNVMGSFLLGAVMHVGLQTELLSPTARLVLATGVMGGFTTYSTCRRRWSPASSRAPWGRRRRGRWWAREEEACASSTGSSSWCGSSSARATAGSTSPWGRRWW